MTAAAADPVPVAAQNRAKGAVCLVLSAFGFAAMGMFVRLTDSLGGPVSCFQKGFFRNAVAAAVAGAIFARRRRSADGGCGRGSASAACRGKAWPLLVLRSALGTAGIFLNFYAISRIRLADAMMLNKLAPFFTVAFSWMFLGERLRFVQGMCLCGALGGAALVVKPGFSDGALFPALCGLAGGICAGGAYACVRALGRRGTDPGFIVLFFSLFSCFASLPFVAASPAPMTSAQILSLLGAGCAAALGQFGITAAYRFAEPRSIAGWDYTNIVFAAAFGFALFGQIPDCWSIAGFAAIILCALLPGYKSRK